MDATGFWDHLPVVFTVPKLVFSVSETSVAESNVTSLSLKITACCYDCLCSTLIRTRRV